MTLSAGKSVISVGREIYGFAEQINFASAASGVDRVAFDFMSPMEHYLVEMQPGVDSNGMAADDILSFSLQGNNLAIFQTKFALGAASEPVQSQLPSIKFILPPRTTLRAVFNMQSGTGMIGSATCTFRGVQFG